MKLHRLVLTNYRGITHREIDFPDHGVVVVSGVNEIGKTSMIEALDLLLEAKDRSKNKDVKAVKPTNADVGAEVTAEISTGAYRFVYHKRFHKRPETVLTVSVPRREQLTGDEAHERVRAILDETVDTTLWKAQRVLQAGSTAAVDLSGCDALSRALDVAAGDTATLSGNEPVLIERIDSEYSRYFTPTGRATGEWATAVDALEAAEAEVTRCAGLVADVDERVHRHAELTDQRAQATAGRDDAEARHGVARAAAKRVDELKETLRAAELVCAKADSIRIASDNAHAERVLLRTEVDTRAAEVNTLDTQVRAAADAEAAARETHTAADAAATEAAAALAAAEARVATARRAVDQLADRDEADRLAARLTKIDATQRDHDQVCEQLSGIGMTEDMLARVQDAATALDRAEVSLAAVAATVEFCAATDIELAADGQRVTLAAGESWSTTATTATRVEVPGVLTVQVRPGESIRDAQAKHAVAQQNMAVALAAAQVADLAAARSADQRRRDLQSRRDQLAATLDALCGDDRVDQLRLRLDALRADQPDPAPAAGSDLGAARAELATADAERTGVATASATARRAADEAAGQLVEHSTHATVLGHKLETQRADLAAAADRLAAQRAEAGDDALAGTAAANAQAADTAAGHLADLGQQLTALAPEQVVAELAAAAEAAATLHTQCDQITGALRDLDVELAVVGTEGRQSQLDAAEDNRDHAAAAHTRIGRQARAVQLLRSVMVRHRDDTRARYVEPFRAEIERLGRPVFGTSFEVDVDTDLRICSRTLDGCTVPYESLSGGAKEQLGILARLAGAALVAKEDGVPVLIDDALGFTDPDRLTKMGAVFDAVGAHGQVIVLTCTPARYHGIDGAHRIDLSA